MKIRRPGTPINKYSMRINEDFVEDVRDDELTLSQDEIKPLYDYDGIILISSSSKLYKRAQKVLAASPFINHADVLEMTEHNEYDHLIHVNGKLYANQRDNMDSYDIAFGLSGNLHNVKRMLQLIINLKNILGDNVHISSVYDEPLDSINDLFDETGEYDYDKIYENDVCLNFIDKLTNNTGDVKFEFWVEHDCNELCDFITHICDADSYDNVKEIVYKYFNLEEIDFDLDGYKLIQRNN